MSQDRASETWLSLKKAAAHLNVHAATLRRWADDGEMPHMLTPGGHRRFALSDLEQFANTRRVTQRTLALPQAWATQAMTRARADMPEQADAHWLAQLSEPMRERHRMLGRRLMGLTLQYVSSSDGAHLLEEARAVGKDYAELSKATGMPLTDALQAALFFRDKLLEATLDLSEAVPVRPSDSSKLVKRINALLNVVQLAIAETYESAPASDDAASAARRRKA